MLLALKLVGVVAGFVLVGMFLQTRMIFPASRHVYRTPDAFGWAFEDLLLPVGGRLTHAWRLPVENARGTVLFSHGNAGNIADRLESAGVLRDLGLNVLLYDYGGYGRSTGRPSETRCYQDIRAAWRYLTEQRGIAPERIVLFGRSLGGGPTADLAAEVTPAAVLLESAFLSIDAMAREMIPILPVGPFIRHHFDNADKVGRFTSPLLVIHSPDDTLIPFRHGQGLFDRAPSPKEFVEIRGDHNEGFFVSLEQWFEAVDGFLTPLLGPIEPTRTEPNEGTTS